MKISTFFKTVSFILIFALVFSSILVPISTANAQGLEQSQSPEPQTASPQTAFNSISNAQKVNEQAQFESTDNEKYTELIDKRTEYLKYYQLESKRYEAVSFGYPVHYLDNDQLKEIDNSLQLVTDKSGKQKYVNKANSFKAELSSVLDGDWIASITKDKYKISWAVDGIKTGKASEPKPSSTVENPEAEESPLTEEEPAQENTPSPSEVESAAENTPIPEDMPSTEHPSLPEEEPAVEATPLPEENLETEEAPHAEELTTLVKGKTAVAETLLTKAEWLQMDQGEKRRNVPNISSDVTYKDVLPGIDLQYLVISDRIKENLILNNKTEITEITQRLMTEGGLTLSKVKDGSIIALDSSQNAVFKMQTPYMMDNEGNGCNIDSELIEADGAYILTYKLDQEWLKNAAYPVIIDPTITTSLNPSDIDDTRIASGLPTNNYTLSYIMSTGYGSTSGINYSLVKFNILPALKSSEMIVYAEYSVKRASSSTINSTVTAHEITSAWNTSTVTWNTKPSFNANVEDYSVVDTVAGKTYDWDITRIAKNWYSGVANNGILLKDVSDTGGYKEWFTTNATYGDVPYCYFVYTDFAGMEGYWDYVSSSVGRGGTANVNLYNGNLVYTHSDLEMTGNRMPVGIAHVFNSTSRNDNDSKMLYGNGWRTNFDQRVGYVTIAGTTYYKYTDEDGTVHYFVLVDGVWKAEDGIDLKLSVGGGNAITVSDTSDNKMVFYPVADANKPGFLNYIEDSNGNRQTVGYDSNHRISQITDGAGRVVLLTRNAGGYLEKVRQPVSASGYRETIFTYTSNRLTRIQYPDGKATTFVYDANGNMTSATNFDGMKTTIIYQSAAPYRVTQLEESNGAVLGGRMSLAYGYNRTEITDVEGRKAQYQFNDDGNTVCVIGPDGSAAYSKFGNKVDSTTSNINKVILSSKLQKFGLNYLLNHNFEASSNWTMNSFFGSVGTHDYATDQKYFGAKSLKLSSSNTAGYERASQTLALEKGKTYTLSGYLKTSDVAGNFGAHMGVLYNTASGQPYVTSQSLKGTNGWDRYSVTFTIPPDASSNAVSVYLDLMESSGTVWFDCLQLEEGSVINRYNLVQNADFTSYSGNTPTFWVRNNLAASDTVDTSADNSNPAYMSDTRFKINGDCVPGNWKSIDQAVPVSGNAGDSYVVGGWAKGMAVPKAKDSAYRVFGLSVEFKYTDGTNEYKVVEFNEDSAIWQYVCGAVVAGKNYSSIVIRPHYSAEANTAWFDGIQLFREEFGESFSYDANGNLKSASDLEKKQEQFQYTNNNLVKYLLPDQREYNYTYDTKHNLKTATSPMGLTYSYDYDANGNQISEKVGDSTNYIRTTANYTSNNNYLDYITDPFGQKTDLDFDPYRGTLSSVKDPLNKVITYSYDSATDATEGVTMSDGGTTISSSFSYTNDRLTGVSHNAPDGGNVSFSFSYNGLGWLTQTKVGNQSLSTYDLAARTGLMNSITYGNGQKIDYSYDEIDRLKKTSQSGVDLYSYEYDNSGNIGYHKDSVNSKEYWYEYDSMDRLGKITSKDAGTINWSKFKFDNKNNLTSFIEKIAGTEYTTTYTYDNDDRAKTATYGTNSINISYDSTLGLVTDIERKINGNTVYNTTFQYAPGDGTTSTKSSRVQSVTNGSQTLMYTYDVKGFITQVRLDANNLSQYRYDAFGQLVRENYKWGATSYTMIFAYDVGGNITSKTKYNFVDGDGSIGTPIDTVAYTYDSTWKDKLSSYNGASITYDNIGNPLTDGTWTYIWTQGRKLQQMTDGTTTATYKYNDQGIRTEKTVNGVTTKYNVIDGLVTWEKKGSGTPIYYLYDDSGNLWGLNYNGTVYFYTKNVQNDIIGIIDGTGSTVVEYSYDAWGKILNISGSMAGTLGSDNPYRYRGYWYDTETGLYSLLSRYYNPEMGRFLNSDIYASTGQSILGCNMFAYCLNNPVNMSDPSGEIALVDDAAIIVAALAAVCIVAIAYYQSTPAGQRSWAGLGQAISTKLKNIRTNIKNAWNSLKSKLNSIITSAIAAKAANELGKIAGKYGTLKCKEAADAMKKYLQKNKLKGSVITITITGGRGYIWSDIKKRTISENGVHVGILYQGRVYCNIHPAGLTKSRWINDFNGYGIKKVTEIKF